MVLTAKPAPEARPSDPKDKEFAARLDTAINGHPGSPDGHGRQKWLRERMLQFASVDVSPEAVRKWFGGFSRPRPSIMREIARVLEVDEAWLSLGLTPVETPAKAAERNAMAKGSVNVMAGLIQMCGGHIAFPENDEEGIDIHAIIDGRRLQIEIKTPMPSADGTLKLAIAKGWEKRVVLALIREKAFRIRIFRVPEEMIENGRRRGGYVEVPADLAVLPEITTFSDLNGKGRASKVISKR
jgi:hypothetical protein